MSNFSAARVASRHLSTRVASRILAARAGIEMDIYARARILEAAAGLPKWSLSKSSRIFFGEGPSHPKLQNVDPEWFARRDLGIAESVLQGAQKVLQAQTGEATAEEIAQNLAAGLATGGGSKSDVYGNIGKHQSSPILSGKTGPKAYKSALFGFAQNRAIDVWRKQVRHNREREKTHPSFAHPGHDPASGALDRTPNTVMLSLISGPGGRVFYKWVNDTVNRKGSDTQKIIFEVSLDYIRDHGAWPPAQAIRDQIIEMKGSDISVSKINRHRKAIQNLLADEMKRDPKVLDWADRYLDLAQLGYGGGQLRAARVAVRFLEAKSYQLSLTSTPTLTR